jgi:hypothetical protein
MVIHDKIPIITHRHNKNRSQRISRCVEIPAGRFTGVGVVDGDVVGELDLVCVEFHAHQHEDVHEDAGKDDKIPSLLKSNPKPPQQIPQSRPTPRQFQYPQKPYPPQLRQRSKSTQIHLLQDIIHQ